MNNKIRSALLPLLLTLVLGSAGFLHADPPPDRSEFPSDEAWIEALIESGAENVDEIIDRLREASSPLADVDMDVDGPDHVHAAPRPVEPGPVTLEGMKDHLVAEGLEPEEAARATDQVEKALADRRDPENLVEDLKEQGVPERHIHPILWYFMDLAKTRVDPQDFYRRLETLGLDTRTIRWINDGKIRIYEFERTETAEAQYDPITNSLYIPGDYLDHSFDPPRIRFDLDTQKINTVIHELDHAEKDLFDSHTELHGKSVWGKMYAGVLGYGKYGAGGAAGLLVVGAFVDTFRRWANRPKGATALAKAAGGWLKKSPWAAAGLALIGASVAWGAGEGLFRHFFTDPEAPRTATQERARLAQKRLAEIIKSEEGQHYRILGHETPFSESNPKSWEVTGYFMGDSVTDSIWDIQQIKLHNQRRIRDAKTPEEVEAVLESLELPPSLRNKSYGSSTEGYHSAYFRLEAVGFPYADHPETFRELYLNSLGLHPPADAPELLRRINASTEDQFPELKRFLRQTAQRRIGEVQGEGAVAQVPEATRAIPEDNGDDGDDALNADGIEAR